MNQQLPMQQHHEVQFQDYIKIIIRRRKTFLLTFFGVVTCVTLFTFLCPPSYEAVATLFVKDDQGKVAQMGDLLLNGPTAVESEIEILKSRSNAERVVSKLHLNWKTDDVPDGVRFKILEFSSDVANVDDLVYRVKLLGGGAYAVVDDDGKLVGNGKSDVLFRGKGLSLLLSGLQGGKGDSFELTLLPFNDTVESLRKKFTILEVGKKTNVISISYKNRRANVARDVVNTLVQAYLDKGVALKSEGATRTVGFVAEQLKGVKSELENAEKNLAAYKSSAGVVQLDAAAQELVNTLSEAEKQKAQVGLDKKQVEFALASLKSTRAKGGVYSPAVIGEDPVLAEMASKLSQLEVQKKGLLTDSTEHHPVVRVVQDQIDELQKKIQATYETAIRNDAKKEESLSREIALRDAQLKKLPATERDLARLMRLSKVNSDIYTFLLQKHEEARIAEASTINNISIVDPAIAPNTPAFPNKKKLLPIGVILGLMTGIGLCLLRDYLDDTLKDPDEAKNAFSLPLLAVIPYVSKKEGVPGLICHNAPKSPASEAFRVLRTGLSFLAVNTSKKVLLVTSSLAGEGKSTVAANLAISLAQAGARTLIVDCDLRRSTQHKIFGLEGGAGLTDVLIGSVTSSAVIEKTSINGLDLIKAGTLPPNPAELLGSLAMQRFLDQVKQEYAHVIIDAPPVIAVADATVLTRLVDLVLVVFEAGKVPAKAGQRTRETLQACSAPLAGFVVSDRNADSIGYGYRYGYEEEQPKPKLWLRLGRG